MAFSGGGGGTDCYVVLFALFGFIYSCVQLFTFPHRVQAGGGDCVGGISDDCELLLICC